MCSQCYFPEEMSRVEQISEDAVQEQPFTDGDFRFHQSLSPLGIEGSPMTAILTLYFDPPHAQQLIVPVYLVPVCTFIIPLLFSMYCNRYKESHQTYLAPPRLFWKLISSHHFLWITQKRYCYLSTSLSFAVSIGFSSNWIISVVFREAWSFCERFEIELAQPIKVHKKLWI